ncbi:hypothetical protein KIN20_031920 [Parelaphostrongylus tenuis]|uniref:Uncharacterized protein n=1 Tax=Parelaphostrongylus tenuis TaxID=148309 RepID=A0AAD5R634_PARTN|nr:hypothetical protein KIN20_031920 [Parelaphostrongylus tenuis]
MEKLTTAQDIRATRFSTSSLIPYAVETARLGTISVTLPFRYYRKSRPHRAWIDSLSCSGGATCSSDFATGSQPPFSQPEQESS